MTEYFLVNQQDFFAAGSERPELTASEQAQLTQKLDERFNLISTYNLKAAN